MILGYQYDRYSKEEITKELIPKDPNEKRLVVITMHNSRAYQIDELDWDVTPKTYQFTWKEKDPQTG